MIPPRQTAGGGNPPGYGKRNAPGKHGKFWAAHYSSTWRDRGKGSRSSHGRGTRVAGARPHRRRPPRGLRERRKARHAQCPGRRLAYEPGGTVGTGSGGPVAGAEQRSGLHGSTQGKNGSRGVAEGAAEWNAVRHGAQFCTGQDERTSSGITCRGRRLYVWRIGIDAEQHPSRGMLPMSGTPSSQAQETHRSTAGLPPGRRARRGRHRPSSCAPSDRITLACRGNGEEAPHRDSCGNSHAVEEPAVVSCVLSASPRCAWDCSHRHAVCGGQEIPPVVPGCDAGRTHVADQHGRRRHRCRDRQWCRRLRTRAARPVAGRARTSQAKGAAHTTTARATARAWRWSSPAGGAEMAPGGWRRDRRSFPSEHEVQTGSPAWRNPSAMRRITARRSSISPEPDQPAKQRRPNCNQRLTYANKKGSSDLRGNRKRWRPKATRLSTLQPPWGCRSRRRGQVLESSEVLSPRAAGGTGSTWGRHPHPLHKEAPGCTAEGTSYATAIASASAALIWSAHPTWTNNQVLRVMMETAGKPEDGKVPSEYLGYGIVRPRKVLLDKEGDPGPADVNPLLAARETTAPPKTPQSGADNSAAGSAQKPADHPDDSPTLAPHCRTGRNGRGPGSRRPGHRSTAEGMTAGQDSKTTRTLAAHATSSRRRKPHLSGYGQQSELRTKTYHSAHSAL